MVLDLLDVGYVRWCGICGVSLMLDDVGSVGCRSSKMVLDL